jgi:hypothetical protein
MIEAYVKSSEFCLRGYNAIVLAGSQYIFSEEYVSPFSDSERSQQETCVKAGGKQRKVCH